MVNDLSLEEIKDSIEYQWRKQQINMLLMVWLFIAVITLFIPLITTINYYLKFLGFGMLIWLCCIGFVGLILGVFILFYCFKNRYLLKNYKNFNSYEVVLDRVSTSYTYKYSISYTIKIVDNGITKTLDTNPYFSNSFFSKFPPDDFNNKKVIGLYDNYKEKFYILKKVN